MKQYLKYIIPSLLILIAVACGGKGKKEKNADLAGKKADLAALKKERDGLNNKIKTLEDAIIAADPAAAAAANEKLVSVATISSGNFSHFVELQGRIDSDNISYISPRGMGGQVRAIYIKKGDNVRTGQLVLKLDDAIIRKNIAAAQQSKKAIEAQLTMARTMYDRQKNLWDQQIGSEMQLIQAKTNVDVLEAQVNNVDENVKVAQEQLKTTSVYSDVSGFVDEVNVRVGEFFQGMVQGVGPQIKVINNSSLKVVVNVPENHIGRIGRGSRVEVLLPDLNKTIEGAISFVSQSIDPNQRGFIAEIKIPFDSRLKPYQVAQVKILDYAAGSAVTVPVNIVQTDDKGKYIFVAVTSSNGKMTARKRPVQVGEFYNDQIEIKSGLQGGEQVITEGYQDLYDGQAITTGTKQ